MIETVRIEDLEEKISQVVTLVKQLKSSKLALKEELSTTQVKLEEALTSVQALAPFKERVKVYESERSMIKGKIENMIRELTDLEQEENAQG